MKNKGKGNIKEQRKRRSKRLKNAVYREEAVYLIDGNKSHYPVGYCNRKEGYLTQGLVDIHGCHKRRCGRYIDYDKAKENVSS